MEFWDKFPIIPTVIEVNKYFAGPKMGTNRKASEMAFLKKLEWWEIVRWKCWSWGKWKILDSIQVIIKANIKKCKNKAGKTFYQTDYSTRIKCIYNTFWIIVNSLL